MRFPFSDKMLWPRRIHALTVGTVLTIVAIAGVNAFILDQLHHNTFNDVQIDLLRQSLTLSELVDRTFQSVDLVLASTSIP
jgi:hypothetical protein